MTSSPRSARNTGSYCPDCRTLLEPRATTCAGCERARPSAGWPTDGLLFTRIAGRFRVDGLLGEGGFGAVYLATHERLGGERAIKVLRRELMFDDTLLERFAREARALYQLDAPQLVKVEEFGRLDDGRPFMVMELADGERLDRLIRGQDGLEPVRVLRIARGILLALAEAHAHGILHRDLKAENVVVKSDPILGERVKVLDLGIAFILGDAPRLTRATRAVGTPEFMAPEQWEGEALDSRCDLYALGVLMYEMLTGDVPFPRDSGGVASIYHQMMSGRPTPVSATRRDLPRGLEGFVFRLMARERETRPDDAVAALRELERIRADMRR